VDALLFPPSSAAKSPAAEEKLRVLIVEDDRASPVRAERADQCRHAGAGRTGTDARARRAHLHPDLVLMDLHMPHANGVELVSWLERCTHHHAVADGSSLTLATRITPKKSLLSLVLRQAVACDAAIDGVEQA